jgi:hypothetical protein
MAQGNTANFNNAHLHFWPNIAWQCNSAGGRRLPWPASAALRPANFWPQNVPSSAQPARPHWPHQQHAGTKSGQLPQHAPTAARCAHTPALSEGRRPRGAAYTPPRARTLSLLTAPAHRPTCGTSPATTHNRFMRVPPTGFICRGERPHKNNNTAKPNKTRKPAL